MSERNARSATGRSLLSTGLQWIAALAVLGSVGVVIWAKVIRTTKESPTHAISRITGRPVSCTEVGTMDLREGRSVVLLCTDAAGYRACWAHFGDAVMDVTNEVRATRRC